MGYNDRVPLQNTPTTAKITARANNRLGAVYSALYSFWMARHTAIQTAAGAQGNAVRRDAYSVVLFDSYVETPIENDFHRTPDALLDAVLPAQARGGTNYTLALQTARDIMERHWSTER
jgi:hypothetical protein